MKTWTVEGREWTSSRPGSGNKINKENLNWIKIRNKKKELEQEPQRQDLPTEYKK